MSVSDAGGATSLRIRSVPFDDPDAQAMVAQVQDFYTDLYGGVDRDRTDPAEFAPPNGQFLLASVDGDTVACGGWRRHDARTAEIKRMFVVAPARGRGVARELLAALESTAVRAGVTVMTLNTGYRQSDAIAFYEAHGYRPTDERFGHYAQTEGAYFFSKQLAE